MSALSPSFYTREFWVAVSSPFLRHRFSLVPLADYGTSSWNKNYLLCKIDAI